MLFEVFVGGLLIRGDKVLLKKSEGLKYTFPGKMLEQDETLETALMSGIKRDTGWSCAVGSLSYVIETFARDDRHTLQFYFTVTVPNDTISKIWSNGVTFVPIEELGSFDVHPPVLVGKFIVDQRRGSRNSAAYLVSSSGD